jgi:hypothetical protein
MSLINKKIKYGIKNGKVIKVYPHKISKKVGRHQYSILWKTTRKNLPGKTFHGKFYKSKKQAMNYIKKTKKNKKHVQKGGRWYDTYSHETDVGSFSGGDYAAMRNVAFGKKYIFNPPDQG